ncbi:MAG TPA: hypothetical protein VMV19_19720 [Xanthobacteraceae bacterium]|nr:hypothetical protein [Xanthobacteraceae bacterium]
MRFRPSLILIAGFAVAAVTGNVWLTRHTAAPAHIVSPIAAAFAAPAVPPRDDSIARLLASLESKAPPRVSHRVDGVQLAGRCGATQYYCNNPTPYCCWSQSQGYYCATDVNHC